MRELAEVFFEVLSVPTVLDALPEGQFCAARIVSPVSARKQVEASVLGIRGTA